MSIAGNSNFWLLLPSWCLSEAPTHAQLPVLKCDIVNSAAAAAAAAAARARAHATAPGSSSTLRSSSSALVTESIRAPADHHDSVVHRKFGGLLAPLRVQLPVLKCDIVNSADLDIARTNLRSSVRARLCSEQQFSTGN